MNGQPVLPTILDAIGRSAKLAGLALLMTDPDRDRRRPVRGTAARPASPTARSCLLGVTSSSIPEFVDGTILVVVVGVQLGLLPVLATPPRNAGLARPSSATC